jgi:RNA polymerase sigma-70 factor (ECF subfamily)
LADFVDELAARIDPELPAAEVAAAVERIHADDLYLALACRGGHREALRRFEAAAIEPLGPAVRRVDSSEAFVDEVRQRVRTKLLVPPAQGKLSHYAGQGPLATWVRVVAVREALDQRRGPKTVVSDEGLADFEHGATGPELGIVKAQYREQFAAAFQVALAELEPAQRNLLRLHHLHGLGVDALAPVLGVHRSNVARRIQKARRALLANTRRRLQIELAIGRDDFEQLMTMIASRLDLSLERYMK